MEAHTTMQHHPVKPNLVKERITDGQGYNRDFAHKIDGVWRTSGRLTQRCRRVSF